MSPFRPILAAVLLASTASGALAIAPEPSLREQPAAPAAIEPPPALEFISLPPLLFEFDTHVLDEAALRRLEEIALFLRHQPRVSRILLRGHADILAGEAYNEKLAWHRAEAVRSQLLELGVPPQLLHTIARGQSDPVDHNDTSPGRARNRRVEMYVIVK
ncbi:MAG: OmpA family protein [Gammaproteobacteria bacterium]|jgi:outer membrane protein OmpA-like peptidoglycan-associated protein|nr:OmpA family protein [Gammaproteobacteria bacterium]